MEFHHFGKQRGCNKKSLLFVKQAFCLLAAALTSYFFIRIPQIGLASVFLIFGQIKLKIILNLYPN